MTDSGPLPASASSPAVGSSRATTGVPIATVEAMTRACGGRAPRSPGCTGAASARPTASSARAPADRRSALDVRPSWRGPNADLGEDGPAEDLAIGVRDAERDDPRELRDAHRAWHRVRRSSTRPAVGRSSPSRCCSSVVLPLPFGPDEGDHLAGGDRRGRRRRARAPARGSRRSRRSSGDHRSSARTGTPTGSSPEAAMAGSASTSPTGPTGPRRPSCSTATRSHAAARSRVSVRGDDDRERRSSAESAHDRDQALGRVRVEVGQRLVEDEVPRTHRQQPPRCRPAAVWPVESRRGSRSASSAMPMPARGTSPTRAQDLVARQPEVRRARRRPPRRRCRRRG